MRDIVVGGSGLVVGGMLGSGVVIGLEALVAGAVGITLLLVSPATEPVPVETVPVPQAQAAAPAPPAQAPPAPAVRVPVVPAGHEEALAAAEADMERAAQQMEQDMARAEAEMARAEQEMDLANQVLEAQLEALNDGDLKKVNLAPLGLPVDVPIPKIPFGKRKGRSRK